MATVAIVIKYVEHGLGVGKKSFLIYDALFNVEGGRHARP